MGEVIMMLTYENVTKEDFDSLTPVKIEFQGRQLTFLTSI